MVQSRLTKPIWHCLKIGTPKSIALYNFPCSNRSILELTIHHFQTVRTTHFVVYIVALHSHNGRVPQWNRHVLWSKSSKWPGSLVPFEAAKALFVDVFFFGYYPIPVDPYLPSQYLDHLGSIGNIHNIAEVTIISWESWFLTINDSMKLSFEVKHEISNKPLLSPCQCRVVRARWYRKNCPDRCSTRHGRGYVLQCSYKNWCNMMLSKAIVRHFPWITWIGSYIIRYSDYGISHFIPLNHH